MICGGPRIPLTAEQAAALAPDGWWCCWPTVLGDGDPRECTCWEPVYDLDQADELATDLEPTTRETRCVDCAFRPESADRDEFPEQADHGQAVLVPPGDAPGDRLGAPGGASDRQPLARLQGAAGRRRALPG